ncbi:hypothetical protein ACEWY4_001499 [Coilia grayii]|uniref:Myb/SANT-like DNA-binding domain-containing protein n=1 Tax=Coilia grayii TaxID=363190 RepID=A0ABD1KTP7_9TELE
MHSRYFGAHQINRSETDKKGWSRVGLSALLWYRACGVKATQTNWTERNALWASNHFLFLVSVNSVAMKGHSNRGETWTHKETKCLIDIWSDEHIQQQLSTTHKNSCIYALFSKQLREKGYVRTVAQCRIKTKKLRSKYIEVRDALSKTGSSGKEKDKFPWYDALDGILGTKPIVDPVDVVENDSSTPSPLESTAVPDPIDPCDTDVDETPKELKFSIPGAQARKRKAKSSRAEDDDLRQYMIESRRMMQEIQAVEQRRLEEEAAAFERMMRAQLEADERRFQALQAQQQANNQMFMQLMSTLISVVPRQSQSMSPWTTPPPSRAWSVPQPYQPQPAAQPLVVPPHPQDAQNQRPSTSSILHDMNSQQDFHNL